MTAPKLGNIPHIVFRPVTTVVLVFNINDALTGLALLPVKNCSMPVWP